MGHNWINSLFRRNNLLVASVINFHIYFLLLVSWEGRGEWKLRDSINHVVTTVSHSPKYRLQLLWIIIEAATIVNTRTLCRALVHMQMRFSWCYFTIIVLENWNSFETSAIFSLFLCKLIFICNSIDSLFTIQSFTCGLDDLLRTVK